MPGLVALDLSPGPDFVDALRRVWDRGDAVFPLDPRLPGPARQAVLEVVAPTAILTADGSLTQDAGGHPVVPGDALVVATSGSTGAPRAVVLTHDAIASSARVSSDRLRVVPGDHWLACLPLSHVGGLAVVTRALHTGTDLTVLPSASPEEIAKAQQAGANLVSLVPTLLHRVDVQAFKAVLLGGSKPPADRPANVIATYGLTESGSGVVYDGWPLDEVEIRIDEEGVIHLRGPMLLRCYRDAGLEIDPFQPGGWFATGDVGEWLPDGRLQVFGRRGDLIITGGENVWPEAVENVLAEHEAVAAVAVNGRPDAEWGHVVVAWVVPADRAAPPTLDRLRSHVKRHLPAAAAPRVLELVDQLPHTTSGKVSRHSLPR